VAVAAASAVVVVAAAAAVDVVARQQRSPLSAEKKTMKFKQMMHSLAIAALIAAAPEVAATTAAPAKAGAVQQQRHATPEEAASALAEAVRAEDPKALLAVVGPSAKSWLASGDTVADRAEWQRFLAAYDRKHGIERLGDDRALLLAGDDDWPFPAPLVRKGAGWVFDANAGREEILNRRIGRNELDTIQTLLAVVDAQREYAAGDLDGNGSYDYARRFVSSEGTRDGLFWPVAADQQPSPLGPLVADATREGYRPSAAGGRAYHGYRFRILSAQGPAASGGAYSYLVDGRMIGGFAVVAYPVSYGVSGVMSFIVNHDGIVYQKNLGRNSEAVVTKMQRFNPDAGWTKVKLD
jgi:hypothetical protein